MGTFTAYSSVNLLSDDFWYGSPDYDEVSFTTAQVAFYEPDLSIALWTGQFLLDRDNFAGGTIEAFNLRDWQGLVVFEGTDFAIDSLAYIDRLQADDSFGVVTLTFAGDDVLNGSDGGDTLVGMDGNDVVNGGGGEDDLNGNQGNDLVTGGSGADYARGGQGDDTVRGGGDSDWHVNGSLGNDLVYGDLGDDTLFGGQGDDQVFGGDGGDWLSGDLGNDSLSGGSGGDRFVFRSGGGADRVIDFASAQGDKLELEAGLNGTGVDSFSELQGRMTGSAQGTLIDLGGGNSLLIQGVQPAGLSAGDVLFF
ncbi:calcium-binding protein [Stella sp.]|uniref:calcium-binding protein n=1 Tax=Stella sp. TaxID=2912054 RepID=UPI0035AEFA9C